jgi:hypothetical protein
MDDHRVITVDAEHPDLEQVAVASRADAHREAVAIRTPTRYLVMRVCQGILSPGAAWSAEDRRQSRRNSMKSSPRVPRPSSSAAKS